MCTPLYCYKRLQEAAASNILLIGRQKKRMYLYVRLSLKGKRAWDRSERYFYPSFVIPRGIRAISRLTGHALFAGNERSTDAAWGLGASS